MGGPRDPPTIFKNICSVSWERSFLKGKKKFHLNPSSQLFCRDIFEELKNKKNGKTGFWPFWATLDWDTHSILPLSWTSYLVSHLLLYITKIYRLFTFSWATQFLHSKKTPRIISLSNPLTFIYLENRQGSICETNSKLVSATLRGEGFQEPLTVSAKIKNSCYLKFFGQLRFPNGSKMTKLWPFENRVSHSRNADFRHPTACVCITSAALYCSNSLGPITQPDSSKIKLQGSISLRKVYIFHKEPFWARNCLKWESIWCKQ